MIDFDIPDFQMVEIKSSALLVITPAMTMDEQEQEPWELTHDGSDIVSEDTLHVATTTAISGNSCIPILSSVVGVVGQSQQQRKDSQSRIGMTQQFPTDRQSPSQIEHSYYESISMMDEKNLIQHVRMKEIDIIVQWYNHRVIQRGTQLTTTTTTTTTTSGTIAHTTADRMVMLKNSSSLSSSKVNPSVTLPVSVTTSSISPTEFLIVTGPTGCGKRKLIQHAIHDDRIICNHRNNNFGSGGYTTIYGSFDNDNHHHPSNDPYCAYQRALMDWTDQVLREVDSSIGRNIITTLRDTMKAVCDGNEMNTLLQFLPSLSTIINYKSDDTTTITNDIQKLSTDHKATAAINIPTQNHVMPSQQQQQQFHVALCNFLRAISASLLQPIVFVLENLQFADPSSVDVLCYMLTDNMPNVFVIGSYAGNGLDEEASIATTTAATNYFVERIRDIERNSHGTLTIRTIPIRNLNDVQVNYVLNQIIPQQQGSRMDLHELCAVVVEETYGNMFLITEFFHWLQDNRLLTKMSNSWTWHIDDIHRSIAAATSSSEHIDQKNIFETKFYISSRLEKLPTLMLEVLKVGACLSSSRIEIRLIEYVLNCPIQTMIHDAVKMGVLECIGTDEKLYSFVHDEIKNAAYNRILESNRELFHLEVGRRLWRGLDRNEIDQYMFVILSQLHIGRRLISRTTERYSITTLCLHAGQKAAKSSTFRMALVYFKFGIELLGGDSGWRDEYDLSLLIHNAAIEMEMCNANYEGIQSLVTAVICHSRRPEDAIQAKTTQLHSLLVNNQQQKGLELGRELVWNLGHGLPKRFHRLNFLKEMYSIQRLLKGKSNDYLKRLPLISDEKVLASMHILNLMCLHAFLERPDMAPFIALKMMHLTLRYGLSFISPQVFVIYGMICISAKSDRAMAFRFGDLALELIETLEVREYIPRVYATYYACIRPWKYPLRDGMDRLIYAHHIGLQTGDVEFSYLCASLWLFHAYDDGMPLDEIDAQWTFIYNSMRSCRQQSLRHITAPAYYHLKFNHGDNVNPGELDSLLQSSYESGIFTARHQILWVKAEMALHYNNLEHADEIAISAGLSKEFWKIPCSPDIVNVSFTNGMIAFACLGSDYKGQRRRSRRQYIREGKAMIRSLTTYARWCPVNFVHKKLLLEAEHAVAIGQRDLAIEKYVCAIGMSREHNFLPTLAWANERYGRYCFNVLNRQDDAKLHFNQALLSYQQWKGQRKVDHLRSDLLHMYGKNDYDKYFGQETSLVTM